MKEIKQLNIFGEELSVCCTSPMTGYYRDGHCRTGNSDLGEHITCVEITEKFLEFSKSRGNDLITPRPDFGFKGLKEGDHWCLCASRWVEALEAGLAPKVFLESTHENMLKLVQREILEKYGTKRKHK